MLRLVKIICLLSCAAPIAGHAQPRFDLARIATPAQPDAIPLYPAGAIPASTTPERWGMLSGQLGAGATVQGRIVRNISQPTITPVLPAPGKATGAAVIIAPGGAFLSLSVDTEGYDVARKLADQGIAAFILKYRTNPVPDEEPAFMRTVGETMSRASQSGDAAAIADPFAGHDALQALRLVRQRAAEWHIDPARVGMMGFSAGAITALLAVTMGTPTDQPAFIGYIYGPMTTIPVPAAAPPMFAAIAMDDGLFKRQGFAIVEAWRAAGRPVELHAYERGDHGFGAGRPGTTTMLLLPEFVAWLSARGMLKR